MTKPIIRNRGEGEQRWFAGGGLFTMKATAAETAGALMLFEDRVVRGKTTPLHVHPGEDELVYVIEGELLVHVDGADHRVCAGGLFFAPRGTPHALLVTSETAHLLVMQTPGSGEAFYRMVSDPSSTEADVARPPDLARLREGAARNRDSIQLLGPPPFGQAAADARSDATSASGGSPQPSS